MNKRVSGALGALVLSLAVLGVAGHVWAGADQCPRATTERLPLRIYQAPRFDADLTYFALDAETYRLEAWLSVMNDDLQFVKKDGRYRANYEITMIANDRGGKQVKGDQVRKYRWVGSYEGTNQTDSVAVDRLTLKVPHGEYHVVLRVRDVGSGVESEGRQKVLLPAGSKGPWLSSFKFLKGAGARGEQLTDTGALVGRSYGDSLPVMRVYVELYGMDPDRESVELAYELADSEASNIVVGKGRPLSTTGFGVPYVIELQTDSLSIGAYDLKVVARRAEKAVASMCGTFRVKSSDAVWFRDFDKMLDLLSYIGTKNQLRPLKEAPEEERRGAWEEFWAQMDPTPETSRNEVQDEFFERVAYANKHFGEMLGEGWQTDRGRIYITEGPPDSIESHPMDMSGNPWEAWYYNRRGIIFIFVDRSGFGEYVLVGTR